MTENNADLNATAAPEQAENPENTQGPASTETADSGVVAEGTGNPVEAEAAVEPTDEAQAAAADDAPADAAAPADEPAEASVQSDDAPAPVEAPAATAGEPAADAAVAPTPAPPAPATPASVAPAAAAVAPAVPAVPSTPSASAAFGRVDENGTVYVRTPEGEREVGSYPGASSEEALAYFARKYDEVAAVADLLYQRVTQTDLSAKDASDGLTHLRTAAKDLRAVGDLVALDNKIETIATAVEARRAVETEQRAAARAEAIEAREKIVAEAETIAGQPENKIQWKSSSNRMRELLDEWKAAQRQGTKIDRETEQALWHRLSSSRNSFDKMRRVHFAQLGQTQAAAKAAKEELVAEAEKLATSTDWGATAGAYKRLMDQWRQSGRASRSDDDALWKRFKAAQDSFFSAKDSVVAAENAEFKENLVVKEQLLAEAEKLLPIKDVERAKAALRVIQDKWDAAGKVPRGDMDRIERGMRRVEAAVRDAGDRRWAATNPEVAARAASLAEQAEKQLEKYRKALAKAEASGDAAKVAKAKEALEAREAWLKQAQAGLAEFGN
ncbi:MAG: DUF349 domain-containing protein [Dermatophilus congolensis]|nr:DUF349 domain-containing protein [Dermatophilus congolensis]